MSIVTRIVTPSLSDLSPTPTGGATYTPAMMQYDGATGYQAGTFTSTGNKTTLVARFARSSFTGDGSEYIVRVGGPTGYIRIALVINASDNSTVARRSKVEMLVKSSTNTDIARLISINTFDDGNEHTVLCSVDADAGSAVMYIDGSDEDDPSGVTRIAPTTGTLDTGASSSFSVASASSVSAVLPFGGTVGFCGHSESYLTNWSDFMDSNGNPIKQDETVWSNSGWGSQPLFWNEHGEMSNNQGSAGNMTENGAPVIAPAIDPA